METSKTVRINVDLEIRVVTAPFFLATKIETFFGRGCSDFLSSHDMEDIISIINGRKEIIGEVAASFPELRTFLSARFTTFLADESFLESLPGHLLPTPATSPLCYRFGPDRADCQHW